MQIKRKQNFMIKEFRFLIQELQNMHKEKNQSQSSTKEMIEQKQYFLDRQMYQSMTNEWFKTITHNPEKFNNMPTELFKLYDFIAIALQQANDSYKRKIKTLNLCQEDTENLVDAFQAKMIEKSKNEFEKIQIKKESQESANAKKLVKDIQEANKLKI